MAPQPGWYRDPGGQPGMLRFFDGARWTDQLRPQPQAPSPAPAPQQPAAGPGPFSTTPQGTWAPQPQGPATAAPSHQTAQQPAPAGPFSTSPQGAWAAQGGGAQAAEDTQGWAAAPERPARRLPPVRVLVAAALALVVVVAGIGFMTSGSGTTRQQAVETLRGTNPLLSEKQAGCIVDKLNEQGVPYDELVSRRTPSAEETVRRSEVALSCTRQDGP